MYGRMLCALGEVGTPSVSLPKIDRYMEAAKKGKSAPAREPFDIATTIPAPIVDVEHDPAPAPLATAIACIQ